jgi:anthranilate phosphoribosyltransferase
VVAGVGESLELITSALSGAPDDRSRRARHMIALNAGAALYVAGVEESMAAGVRRAVEVLESGAALQKLHQLAAMTQGF